MWMANALINGPKDARKYFKKLKPEEKDAVVMVSGSVKNSFNLTSKDAVDMTTKLYLDERETFMGIICHQKGFPNLRDFKEWYRTCFKILDKDTKDRIVNVNQILKKELDDTIYYEAVTAVFFQDKPFFKKWEDRYEYEKSMGPLWCVSTSVANMKGDKTFHNEMIRDLVVQAFDGACKKNELASCE